MDIHRAENRGKAEYGWLIHRHTFSLSNYHNPDRKGVGKLRVLNDDIVEPGMGFDTHSHKNIEIVTIPLSGTLRQKNNLRNEHIITTGEIQIMSAGKALVTMRTIRIVANSKSTLLWLETLETGMQD